MKRTRCVLLSKLILFICIGLLTYSCSNSSDQKQSSKEQEKDKEKEGVGQVSLVKETDDTSIAISSFFDIPELNVLPSPNSPESISLGDSEKIIDYNVSPAGINVASIVESKERKFNVKLWQIGSKSFSDTHPLPAGFSAKAIVWHPNAKSLFVMGEISGKYEILCIEKNKLGWGSKVIFSTPNKLMRLVMCPRPFVADHFSETRKQIYYYRIFFGMDNGDDSYRIVSITENGDRFYQVVGPSETITDLDGDTGPSSIVADWALPQAFNPAGHQLIWQDKKQNFYIANYAPRFWEDSKPFHDTKIKKGTINPTPNGLGLLHWQGGQKGIGVYLLSTKQETIQASDYNFISAPLPVPDGKGIVGLTQSKGKQTLNYTPINVPLADVVNAWMFAETGEEVNLFQTKNGLFRPNHDDQLYKLYETENYDCGGYGPGSPTRPYMVTTDIFWELFGSAYQGIFIIKERNESMPNFWNFVKGADKHFKSVGSNSPWAPVFAALTDLSAGKSNNPEVKKINELQDDYSEITKDKYDYSDLKPPRGHYSSSEEMQKYFKAFRYFTTVFNKEEDQSKLEALNALPKEIKSYAINWIKSYQSLISPSKSPLVWKDLKNNTPVYCTYPGTEAKIFPLSWGFDNEVLYSTVYHPNVPEDKQITGPNGPRLMPSGLDLAAALGSGFAESLLESDYKNYPPLKKVIENLKDNFQTNGKSSDNLYSKWINALAIQWAEETNSLGQSFNKGIWQSKRLQTGLASWATLRHATVLVNERSSAECGEGGYEEILLRAPRGYVEPDPQTFNAVAKLFEEATKYVSKNAKNTTMIATDQYDVKEPLYEGIVNRLKEAAQNARDFQVLAEKQKRGEAFTNEENAKILYVASVAEHLFLVFNSLSNKDYALSTPDPMAKIADVAGGGTLPYLMSAVGNSMEWDHIVPYYGRRHIVKGSVYSYYEFVSDEILNDEEWREKVKTASFLPWIKPYITEKGVSYPAKTKY